MSEQDQPELDAESILRQFEQAAEAFNHLEQAIIEASKAMTAFAAVLATAAPVFEQPDADWAAANRMVER